MNQVATKPAAAPPPGLIEEMARRYGVDAQIFASTIRKTVMPANATTEEFAAFLMVAREYNLSPLLREIHAFPKKGGGIQPVVSIDGWINIINQQPQLDGYEMEAAHDDNGELVSFTCTMYRKDRKHPVVVTEYLSECMRPTEPWKMKHRMLRHKALIQAARYAFGLSGIMDEDEAEMVDVTPPKRPERADFRVIDKAITNAAGSVTAEQPAGVSASQPDAPAGDLPEFGHADAMELGRIARRDGKPRKCPADVPLSYEESWLAGWDDAPANA